MIAAVALVVVSGLAAGVVPIKAASSSTSVGAGNVRAEQIAATSKPAKEAMAVLEKAAKSIRDPAIKRAVLDILAKPAPTFLSERLTDRAAQRQKLIDAALLDASVSVDALFPPHER